MHYKALLDPAKYLGPLDFAKEREVTISRMSREKLPKREKEEEQSAPMLWVVGRDGKEYERPLKMPKSVLHGLSLMFGVETDGWVGKKITVFATWCISFGDREECVRLRFPAEIDAKVRKWLKKRKAPASCYMIDDDRGTVTKHGAAPLTNEEMRKIDEGSAP